ncbi:hypothetical protein ACQQ2N_01915 [Dokdonella sp. MW10]|uniref:hypothetical protein n=1 Tax=Dokdonella sp. MW10 TaxID=2992926 RepID=UPI003F80FCD3
MVMQQQDFDARGATSMTPAEDDLEAGAVPDTSMHGAAPTFERRELAGEFFGYRWDAEVRVWETGGAELVTVVVRDPSGQRLASLRPRDAPHASIEAAAAKAESLARAVLR